MDYLTTWRDAGQAVYKSACPNVLAHTHAPPTGLLSMTHWNVESRPVHAMGFEFKPIGLAHQRRRLFTNETSRWRDRSAAKEGLVLK